MTMSIATVHYLNRSGSSNGDGGSNNAIRSGSSACRSSVGGIGSGSSAAGGGAWRWWHLGAGIWEAGSWLQPGRWCWGHLYNSAPRGCVRNVLLALFCLKFTKFRK